MLWINQLIWIALILRWIVFLLWIAVLVGPREGRERTLSRVKIEPTTFASPLVHRLSFKAEKRKKALGKKDATSQEINITY